MTIDVINSLITNIYNIIFKLCVTYSNIFLSNPLNREIIKDCGDVPYQNNEVRNDNNEVL